MTVETAVEIRPFQIEVPQAEIDELRRRLQTTRWLEQETVGDESQGVQVATMQELVRYWGPRRSRVHVNCAETPNPKEES